MGADTREIPSPLTQAILMVAVNIGIRVLVVLVGIALLFRLPPFSDTTMQAPLQELFGVIVILYGSYRLISYRTARRKAHED